MNHSPPFPNDQIFIILSLNVMFLLTCYFLSLSLLWTEGWISVCGSPESRRRPDWSGVPSSSAAVWPCGPGGEHPHLSVLQFPCL